MKSARWPGIRRFRPRSGAILALTVAIACAGCGTVDRDDLSSYLDQLHSDAAEGVLLAGQAAKGALPVSFTWIHSAELVHHVQEILRHLDTEMPGQGLAADITQAKLVAGEIEGDFEQLHADANDRSTARSVEISLTAHAKDAESLFEKVG